ncbi:Predicted NTPase (NACHT family) [uncultured Eubacterium sp.]|nr:Predicted NTPase (NACHT family) [uncultured Eubacterium sp.]
MKEERIMQEIYSDTVQSFGDSLGENAGAFAANLFSQIIKRSWRSVKHYFSEAKDIALMSEEHYETYLHNVMDKHGTLKNLNYRNEPKNILAFYEELNLVKNDEDLRISDIDDLLIHGKKFLITGTAGSGKSTLLKFLFMKSIEKANLVPVFIELRKVNIYEKENIKLVDFIISELKTNGFVLSNPTSYNIALEKNAYILFFDGLDEVDKEKIGTVTEQIKTMCSDTKIGQNIFIISSRPSPSFISWNNFIELNTKELDLDQAIELIKKIQINKEIKDEFCNLLETKLFAQYKDIASNPLYLSVMLLTYIKDRNVFRNPKKFFDLIFSVLLVSHDETKDGYERRMKSNLKMLDFRTVFSSICFGSFFDRNNHFDALSLMESISDAKKNIDVEFEASDFMQDLTDFSLLTKDAGEYQFTNDSFREYFAAYFAHKKADKEELKCKLINHIKKNTIAEDKFFNILFLIDSDLVNTCLLRPSMEELRNRCFEKNSVMNFMRCCYEGFRVVIYKKLRISGDAYTVAYNLLPVLNTELQNLFILSKFNCDNGTDSIRTYDDLDKDKIQIENRIIGEWFKDGKSENDMITFDFLEKMIKDKKIDERRMGNIVKDEISKITALFDFVE